MSEMRLYNTDGNRLYLTTQERAAFLDTARLARPEVRSFAETLAYTGCRISVVGSAIRFLGFYAHR